jgi:hypothetical protein
MLLFYQCCYILIAAKKGLNVGNIIYGHKKFFPAKIHSLVNFIIVIVIIIMWTADCHTIVVFIV